MLNFPDPSARCLMSAMRVQDVKIDPGNGIPYLLDHPRFKIEQGLPYALAQHSGPWHLREAITGSKYVTTDMDKADIVYVYDHCYYMLWLAQASPSAAIALALVQDRSGRPPALK